MPIIDEALEKIKGVIPPGGLRPGDRLPKEPDLAAQIGLCPTPRAEPGDLPCPVCEAVPVDETDWERRVADAWASLDDRSEEDFRALIERLAAERPPGDGVADFERACSFDSTGHSDRAVPLYRQALAEGLTGERRRRAVIQLASSLRNLGRSGESVALLTEELDAGSDHLDDAVRVVLALALTDVGREREAVALAVGALAAHLPRYQRSMAGYARLLVEPE